MSDSEVEVEIAYNKRREALEKNSIEDLESVTGTSKVRDFSMYPQFSPISSFIDYMVESYYTSCQEGVRNKFHYELDNKTCETCGSAASYIHLTISVENCTMETLWLHRTFCSPLCHDYFYTVKMLGGTP